MDFHDVGAICQDTTDTVLFFGAIHQVSIGVVLKDLDAHLLSCGTVGCEIDFGLHTVTKFLKCFYLVALLIILSARIFKAC